MKLKTIVIIFIIVYSIIGVFVFTDYFKNKKDEKSHLPQSQEENLRNQYTWNVKEESLSDYRAPSWLRDSSLKNYMEEVHFATTDDLTPEFTARYQLMSFIAQLQLGDPLLASSFINPEISYMDYEVRLPKEMESAAENYAQIITKGKTIIFVSIEVIEEEATTQLLKLKIVYEDSSVSEIHVSMILIEPEDDHDQEYSDENHEHESMWFINQNMTNVAESLSKNNDFTD